MKWILSIFAALLLAGTLQAQTDYYVNPSTGNDANTPTQAQNPSTPWKTLQHCVDTFTLGAAGATCHGLAGNYSDLHTLAGCAGVQTNVCVDRGGTSDSVRFTLQCDVADSCKLIGAPVHGYDAIVEANYTTFAGFEVGPCANCNAGVAVLGGTNFNNAGTNVRIISNYIHDIAQNGNDGNGFGNGCPSSGMVIADFKGQNIPGLQVVGNRINNGGLFSLTSCNQFHGLYINGPTLAQNNIISNIVGEGVNFGPSPCGGSVTGNTVFHNGQRGILIASYSGDNCASFGGDGHMTVNNNIADNNGVNNSGLGCGIGESGTVGNTNLYSNNLLQGNSHGDAVCLATSSSVLNTKNEATATTFVTFNNNGLGDYHLKTGTLASNSGVSTCASGGIANCFPATDFDSVVRPTGGAQSIGAYVLVTAGSPSVSFSPSPLAFGTVPTSTTATLSVTLTNTGTASLTFTAPSISGTNAPEFVINSTTCSTSLAAGSNCAYVIAFTPTAASLRSANLTLADNAAGSPHQVPLNGTGGAPAITISPTSLSFGVVIPGTTTSAQTVTLTSTGTSALMFTAPFTFTGTDFSFGPIVPPSNCSTGTPLNPGQSCTFGVKFIPSAVGARSGTVSLPTNVTGSPQTIALSGTGGAAVAGLSPSSASCGSQQVGTSVTCQAFTLTNTGNINLTGLTISFTGANAASYSQSNTCPANQTLAPSASCTITLFFKPVAAGTQTANLSIASNDPASPTLAALTGTGATPATITLGPQTFNFNNVLVGTTTASTNITVVNNGGTAATISSVTTSAPFALTNGCPATLPSTGNCLIAITANPSTTGTVNGAVTIVDSASGSPHVASLSVTGTAPTASLAPSSLAFGNQTVGTATSSQSASLANTGTGPMTFTIALGGTDPGDYILLANACSSPLQAGQSCLIPVEFKPTTSGSRPASIVVTDSASGSPHSTTLSGTGIATAPAISLSVTSVNFGNQPVGTNSGSLPIVVTNTGTDNLTVSSVTPTGNFSQTNTCTTIIPGATCTINGTFSPLSAGTITGQFSIVSNAASSPDLVTLQGFGTQTGATLTPTSVSFGSVTVGQPSTLHTLTLANTGNTTLGLSTPTMTGANPSDFTLPGACGVSLAPNATCFYSFTFIPGGAGSRSATFTQPFTGGVTSVTDSFTGTGVATAPAVGLAPTSMDFGSLTQSTTSAKKTIQLNNTGTANLTISSITATGANAADFTVTSHCTSPLIAGGSCAVDVTFTPSTTAAETAAVTFTTNAASSPDHTNLAGLGVAAPAPHVTFPSGSFPSSVSFSPPSIQTGTTSGAQTISPVNNGEANLVVASATLGGTDPGDYTMTNGCGTVTPGNSCSITLNCKPTAAGSRPATLTVTDNTATSPHVVTLSCTGFVGTPTLVLAVSTINFGNTTVGTTSGPAVFTISNTGLATATSVAITSGSSEFSVSDTCGGSITAGSSCSATVRFSPTALCGQTAPNDPSTCVSNVHLGQISVASNTSNSPQNISLQGTAIPTPPPQGPIVFTMSGAVTMGGHVLIGGH